MLGLLRDRDLENFTAGMARELSARVPPDAIATERAVNPKFQDTLARALENLFVKVQQHCRDGDLGMLKKARLSKSFQDQMIGLGYSKAFAKEITMALAKHLTQI